MPLPRQPDSVERSSLPFKKFLFNSGAENIRNSVAPRHFYTKRARVEPSIVVWKRKWRDSR